MRAAPSASGSRTPRIVAVGRMGRGPEADLFARYCGRLRPAPVVVELPESSGSGAEVKRREATRLLASVPTGSWLIALDQGGAALDSVAFAGFLAGSDVSPCFVLGGAEGLGAAVLARAAAVLSLGPMTWPHLLARVMLAEQLYRAQAIASGHPYHRAGRP